MAKFNEKQVGEINKIIEDIQKKVKADSQIGARERQTLNSLLRANKIDKKPVFFNCNREYSEAIVSYFTKEKNLVKNKFHMSAQQNVYLL
jgi:hypothetical protein